MSNISTKFSSYVISFLMGLIIIAFVLTGFQGFSSNTGEVATVDGTPINTKEFNQAVDQQIQQFSQFSKGKSLTQKQIRDFRIRERVLDQLINQKHFLNFATKLQFDGGKEAVKGEIKDLPYFQTGGQFDVNKYKLLLSSNRVTPAEFEGQIVDQVKTQKLGQLLESMRDSQKKINSQYKLENTKSQINYALVSKNEMRQNLAVSKQDISNFVSNEKNTQLIESLYKTYEAQASIKKEKVKPLASMKSELAKEHIQRTKTKELTEFNDKLKTDLQTAFSENKFSKVRSLEKKYNFEFTRKFELPLSSLKIKSVSLKEDEVLALFNSKDTGTVHMTETDTHFVILRAAKFMDSKTPNTEETKKLLESSRRQLSGLINNSVIQLQQTGSKVTTAANLFL